MYMEKQQEAGEAFSGRTKRQDEEVSTSHDRERTHTRTAPVVGLKAIMVSPVRRRITLVVPRHNVPDLRSSGRPDLEQRFERNRAIITAYLAALEGGGHTLPEDPRRRGEIFFLQVEAEAGLPRNSLATRSADDGESHGVRLRGVIQGAAKHLGVELRILPSSPHAAPAPLTYAQLLERGTEERRRQLLGKGSQRQQLYNTRSALSQFIERSNLEKAAAIGDEFTAGFDATIVKIAETFKNEGTLKKFLTELEWWRDFHRGLLKEQSTPPDFHGALMHLVNESGLTLHMVAKLSCLHETSLKAWCEGVRTPMPSSYTAITRMDVLIMEESNYEQSNDEGEVCREYLDRDQLHAFFTAPDSDTYVVIVRNNSDDNDAEIALKISYAD